MSGDTGYGKSSFETTALTSPWVKRGAGYSAEGSEYCVQFSTDREINGGQLAFALQKPRISLTTGMIVTMVSLRRPGGFCSPDLGL